MKTYIKIFMVGLLGGVIGALIIRQIPTHQPTLTDQSLNQSLDQKIEPPIQVVRNNPIKVESNEDFTNAAKISNPSVVYIKTVTASRQSMDLMDLYFGNGYGSGKVLSSGSGVIYSSDGYIITNNHVIEDAEKVKVIHKKQTYIAKVIGKDPSTDLAVLKIEAKGLPNIKIGRSNTVKVGEWVLAVGNPFNLTSTVTAGIVSAKGRNINILGGQFPLESFIQTDAAINPGNSGGALVNLKGELIGINTAILSRTGTYTGYGFAVPVNIVSKIANDLINHGEVQKAFLGLEITSINTEVAKENDLKSLDGVFVDVVMMDSAGDKIGIQRGDVLLKINEKPINSKAEYDELLGSLRPGEKVKVQYKRDGKTFEKQATLTNSEGTTGVVKREVFSAKLIGAELKTLTKVERNKLGITHGIRVVKVKPGKFFSRMGIREGFVITKINDIKITKPQQVVDVLKLYEQKGGRVVMEGVSQGGTKGYYSFYF